MTLLALSVLVLVCSIFGTTSETNHVSDIPKEIYDDDKHVFNPKLAHLYGKYEYNDNSIVHDDKDEHRQTNGMRYYNVKGKKENNNVRNFIPNEAHKVNIHNINLHNVDDEDKSKKNIRKLDINARRKRETNTDPRCLPFTYTPDANRLTHPKNVEDVSRPGEGTYTSNTTCFTTIEAESNQVIELTFIDVFEIEESPQCINDYLEIRNGRHGYSEPVYRYCGRTFPPIITSTGPYMWLKFRSDEIIEYAGFTIEINFPARTSSKSIHESCYKRVGGTSGVIDGTKTSTELETCRKQTSGPLDVQWMIQTDPGTQIYLNITKFQLANANNCTKNTVQIFGAKPNFDHLIGEYCSSVAKSLWTEENKKHPGPANIMYIRLLTTDKTSNFSAIFTQFRTAESCNEKEYDCKDATCIAEALQCDGIAHCRLKADEDPVDCKGEAQSLVRDKDTRTILIVFSLILTGMISVFLFKCIRKLYNDQKQINEHRAQLCNYLNKAASQITLDPRSMVPGDSPDTVHSADQNQDNERNRHLYRQSSSLESDLLRVPVDEDWPENVPILGDVRLQYERLSRVLAEKEESLRVQGVKEEDTRDTLVEAHDVNEAECQTRESLYQTEPIVPRTNAVSGSKPFSTSRGGSSLAPSPPTPVSPRLTGELLRQTTAQDAGSSQSDRPLSSETTKSAPDVIQIY